MSFDHCDSGGEGRKNRKEMRVRLNMRGKERIREKRRGEKKGGEKRGEEIVPIAI